MAIKTFELGFILKATDLMSGVMDHAREKLGELGETAEHMRETGERLNVAAGLASEGIEKIGEMAEAVHEPAIAMQQVMATTAAVTGASAAELGEFKERAVEFSNTHPGVTAEEWLTSFTRMKGIFGDTKKAYEAADVSGMLGRFGVDASDSARLFQVASENFGVSATKTGDTIAKAMQVAGLAPESMGELAQGIGRGAAAAVNAHAPFSELVATQAEAIRLFGGGRGAMVFNSMLQSLQQAQAQGKIALDFSHGNIAALQQLKEQLVGTMNLPPKFYEMSTKAQEKFLVHMGSAQSGLARLAALGVSDPVQVLNLLNHLGDVQKLQGQLGDTSGTLAAKYAVATNNMADATKLLHQNWENFADALATPALPTETAAIHLFGDALKTLTPVMEHHTYIAAGLSLALQGISTAGHIAITAMQTVGSTMILASYGVQGLGKLMNWLKGVEAVTATAEGAQALATEGLAVAEGSAEVASVGLAASLWAVMAPMLPLIAIAAAVALLAYEIYEHWDAIKPRLVGWWDDVKAAFVRFGAWLKAWAPVIGEIALAMFVPMVGIPLLLYRHWDAVKASFDKLAEWLAAWFTDKIKWFEQAGSRLIRALHDGMMKVVHLPGEAVSASMGFVRRHLPYSPAKEGPLRDLDRVRISETIAASIRPGPVIAAMRGLTLSMLANSAPGASPGRLGGMSGGPTIILNLTYAPVMNGAGGGQRDPRRDADELVRIVMDRLRREARLRFSA